MARLMCQVCSSPIWWRGEWWVHGDPGREDHAVVPPPPRQLPDALARSLAALTGDPVEEWRLRTLVWPDAPPWADRATIYAGRLVRWRLDAAPTEPGGKWVHNDSSSTLLTTDPVEAWRLLLLCDVVRGPCPIGLREVREVIRVAMGRRPWEACQPPEEQIAGGILSSGTEPMRR